MFNTENWVDFETKAKTFEPGCGIYAIETRRESSLPLVVLARFKFQEKQFRQLDTNFLIPEEDIFSIRELNVSSYCQLFVRKEVESKKLTPREWVIQSPSERGALPAWVFVSSAENDLPKSGEDGRSHLPSHPEDFKAVYLLLKEFPELEDEFIKIIQHYPWWCPFYDKWESLKNLWEKKDSRFNGLLHETYCTGLEILKALLRTGR
jgi:hypothetical protein